MLVSVIGPTALVSGLDVAEFPRRQDRQLLAALAVDPRRTWRVDELTDALWPGGSVPSGAGKLVRNLVSRLRGLLGSGSIDSASDGYRLGSAVALDVELLFGHVDPLTELLQFPLSIAGRTEGFTWAQRALALVGDGELDGELAATVGGQTGWNMVQMAQTNGAEQLCTRVLTDALPDCLGAGWAHLGLTVLRGDARDDRALVIALAHDDATLELGTRSMLAGMLAVTDPSSAQAHAEASRLRAARSEEPWQTVLAQYTCAVSLAASPLQSASDRGVRRRPSSRARSGNPRHERDGPVTHRRGTCGC